MTIISIDAATASGVARWVDGALVCAYTVKPRGKSGAYYIGEQIVESELAAWRAVYSEINAVVIEAGYSGKAGPAGYQGERVGYHRALCQVFGLPPPIRVNVAEWRRVIKEDCEINWPADRARKKALAVKLVKALYWVDATDDEADAVLLGRAAHRMGLCGAIPKQAPTCSDLLSRIGQEGA
jgi:hypothetical protein